MARLRLDTLPELPAARARGGAPARLWAYLSVGPRQPITDVVEWARRLAFASTAAHVAIFSAGVLGQVWASGPTSDGDEAFMTVALVVAAVLLGGAQLILTFLAMALASLPGAWLTRLRRPAAMGVGALWAAGVLLLIEPVAGAMWLGLADRMEIPRALFWLAAAITGGLWGAWLGLAHDRPPCDVA